MQGQHTMRHASGASNSTWCDMFIESTFMRYGHSQGGTLTMSIYLIKGRGLTGINLNDIAIKCWALSLHSCSKLIHDLTLMRDNLLDNPTHHNEESKTRMHSDSSDRQKLQAKLSQCFEPLSPVGHYTTLF